MKTTYYMHKISGDVASDQDWHDDFKKMDVESWFGLDAKDCEGLHFIDDCEYLIEVEKSASGEWDAT